MSGDLHINKDIQKSFDDYPAKTISTLSIRINFLKKEIEKTLILNYDGSGEELEFLLKRL